MGLRLLLSSSAFMSESGGCCESGFPTKEDEDEELIDSELLVPLGILLLWPPVVGEGFVVPWVLELWRGLALPWLLERGLFPVFPPGEYCSEVPCLVYTSSDAGWRLSIETFSMSPGRDPLLPTAGFAVVGLGSSCTVRSSGKEDEDGSDDEDEESTGLGRLFFVVASSPRPRLVLP
jgi:hypothetical protein